MIWSYSGLQSSNLSENSLRSFSWRRRRRVSHEHEGNSSWCTSSFCMKFLQVFYPVIFWKLFHLHSMIYLEIIPRIRWDFFQKLSVIFFEKLRWKFSHLFIWKCFQRFFSMVVLKVMEILYEFLWILLSLFFKGSFKLSSIKFLQEFSENWFNNSSSNLLKIFKRKFSEAIFRYYSRKSVS